MDLKKLVEKNKEFNEWKQKVEEEIKLKHQELIEFNKLELSTEDYKALPYEEAKEVFEVVKYNLDYNSHRKEIAETLDSIKKDTFTILNLAHYYPEINKLEYLTDVQKNSVDKVLYKVSLGGYIYTRSNMWYNLKLGKDIESQLFNELYNLGIVERCYELTCSICDSNTIRVLTEEEYLNHKKMFEIFDKHRNKTATAEELQWCDDFIDNGGRVWEISCYNCEEEYQEVEKFEQLSSRATVLYKIKQRADMTFATK